MSNKKDSCNYSQRKLSEVSRKSRKELRLGFVKERWKRKEKPDAENLERERKKSVACGFYHLPQTKIFFFFCV